jgi:hypothetical protein
VRWSCGVTTIPAGRPNLLPRTLASLRAAGFGPFRLFVDGDRDAASWEREFGYDVTVRYPALRTFGNWILALAELLIRNPGADRYLVAQDDFVTCRNVRSYLERCPYPDRGYLNLLTFLDNEQVVRGQAVGWYEAHERAICWVYVGGRLFLCADCYADLMQPDEPANLRPEALETLRHERGKPTGPGGGIGRG